jgi:3-oxoacyl-[acyl-carrier-protein] synthase II
MSRSASRRVVITGLGPVSAFGVGMGPLWSALTEGRSAMRPIAAWDASGLPTSVAAEIPADLFDVKVFVPKSYRKATKVMARDIELAVGAAHEAVRDAGLVTKSTEGATPTLAPDRVGCHIGAGLIAADIDELTSALYTARDAEGRFSIALWGEQGMNNLTPLWLLKYLPNMLACHVTIIHDCQGPSNTITCAEDFGGALDRRVDAGHRARRRRRLPLGRRGSATPSDGHPPPGAREAARADPRGCRSDRDPAALRSAGDRQSARRGGRHSRP